MMEMAETDTLDRVVAHFDVDCFYAQAEVLRRPYLKDLPVGITQKFLVVTTNYVARGMNVPKMASIDEAKQRCPNLVLINGEDLTPYRAASKQICGVLGRFGTVERHGLDEATVDISAEVWNRRMSGAHVKCFSGHVIGSAVGGTSAMDSQSHHSGDYTLMLASLLVAEIRQAVECETGFSLSCGIAHNKMLAKLASSVNKPNKQTTIPPEAVADFLGPMPVRKIPGIGKRTESILQEMGAETLTDLQKISGKQLSARFGDRIGQFLYNACRGCDATPVRETGHCKSLSVEDSFRSCTTLNGAEEILRSLGPDFIFRLDADREETGRSPGLFTLKWRYRESWKFTSLSAPMPPNLASKSAALETRVEAAVELALRLLSKGLRGRPSYNLAVLNIGATQFKSATAKPDADIRSFLQSSGEFPRKVTGKLFSKRDVRAQKESLEKLLLPAPKQNPSELRFSSIGTLAADTQPILDLGSGDDSDGSEEDEWDASGDLGGLSSNLTKAVCAEPVASNVHCLSGGDGGLATGVGPSEFDNRLLEPSQLPISSRQRDQGRLTSNSTNVLDCLEGGERGKIMKLCSSVSMDDRVLESHSERDGATHPHKIFRCGICQQEIVNTDVSRQEHEDFHLALQLDEQEKTHRESGNTGFGLKRRRLCDGTLDSFVTYQSTKEK